MKHLIVAGMLLANIQHGFAGWYLPEKTTVPIPLPLIEQWSGEKMVVKWDPLVGWDIKLLQFVGAGCATFKNKKNPFESTVFLPQVFVRFATLFLENKSNQILKIEFVSTADGLHISAAAASEDE